MHWVAFYLFALKEELKKYFKNNFKKVLTHDHGCDNILSVAADKEQQRKQLKTL